MILKKRLSKVEQMMINTMSEGFTAYHCENDGVFLHRDDIKTGVCTYCKKVCEEIENIEELKE